MLNAKYLTERAQQELRAAMASADTRVRHVHLELANAYLFRLEESKRLARKTEMQLVAETAA